MTLEISAKTRQAQGTSASRRLRRDGRAPGVLYGSAAAPAMIELDHNELIQALKVEAFHASLLTLTLDDQPETVLLRDFQMHPYKAQVLHIDFQRVDPNQEITMRIPLHFINADAAPGVKLAGGVINYVITDVEIRCLPKDLPESIAVDLGGLEAGRSVHASEIVWPVGIKPILPGGDDQTIATCAALSGGSAEETEAEEEA